jgi:hypothetical protein
VALTIWVLTIFHMLCFHRLVAEKKIRKIWVVVGSSVRVGNVGSRLWVFFLFLFLFLIASCIDRWVVGRFLGEIFSCFDFFVDMRSKLVFEIVGFEIEMV